MPRLPHAPIVPHSVGQNIGYQRGQELRAQKRALLIEKQERIKAAAAEAAEMMSWPDLREIDPELLTQAQRIAIERLRMYCNAVAGEKASFSIGDFAAAAKFQRIQAALLGADMPIKISATTSDGGQPQDPLWRQQRLAQLLELIRQSNPGLVLPGAVIAPVKEGGENG